MSVVLNTNQTATMASNNLATSSSMLQKSLNRLSSGSKIVNPSDDAGGLAVSMKLSATAKRQGAVNSNIGNAVSLLQTQDGALKVAGKILDRISELRTLNDDVTKSTGDKANYNTEFTALQSQLTAITSEKFNGVALFGSTTSTVFATEDASTSSQIVVSGRDLGATGSAGGIGSVTSASSLTGIAAISTVTTAIENVATMRAQNGAEQSRLSFASELLTVNKANLEAATSRITDVDVAEESTQLARWNTMVSAGTSMLSQANQSAQTALRLLQ
ncbi:MAG: flagellin [Opitutus sp.]|nr:flagellin [Opitutus sp.]MCS6277870.1 flagellin [Opitutus sp.]MCS6299023.1 flagellin [Opitutus sp.]